MKKEYGKPEIRLQPIDPSDILTLSNGGEGIDGMVADWDQEITI